VKTVVSPVESLPFMLDPGNSPLLISMPHNSSTIPHTLAERMHPYAQSAPDTDWLLNRLYDFASTVGYSVLRPAFSRYVIDLNRAEDDHNLYPGADTTGLCPTTCFDRRPIYLPHSDPSPEEIAQRVQTYWRPYHEALQQEVERLRSKFKHILVFDAHSIASVVPRFFEGILPDLNLGTANGESCDPQLFEKVMQVCDQSGYHWVSNARFKGGYITRAYGKPATGISTLQLELSQATYMHEETGAYAEAKAARLKPVLHRLLETAHTHLQLLNA
jgi:N-formylglutamate deformylase